MYKAGARILYEKEFWLLLIEKGKKKRFHFGPLIK